MKIKILEKRGIYVKGQEVKMSYPQGSQWVASGFAEEVYEAPKAKPKAEKKEAPKKAEVKKPKAEKE